MYSSSVSSIPAPATFSSRCLTFDVPAHLQRVPGDEGDAFARAVVEHFVPLAVGEVVAVLDGNDGEVAPGPLDLLDGHLGEAGVADLSFALKLLDGAELIVFRHGSIDAVQLPEVDALEAEALEAAVQLLAQPFRAAVLAPFSGAGAVEAAFRRDDEVAGIWMQRLGDQFLTDVRSIRFGGIDEIHAELDGPAEDGKTLLAVLRRPPHTVSGQSHGAEAEAVVGKVAPEGERAGLRGVDGLCGHELSDVQYGCREPGGRWRFC